MTALDKFTESAGSKLGEKAASLVATAPVAYAGCALTAWLITTGPQSGLQAISEWAAAQQTVQLLAWAGLGLLAVAASSTLVRQFVPTTIRLLEGYWPSIFQPLADRRTSSAWKRRLEAKSTVRDLAGPVRDGTATAAEERQYVQADLALTRLPTRATWMLPTRLGNILKAAETRPRDKYGLDPIKLWPVTWLVLPESVRGELSTARARLDSATSGLIWCLLGVFLALIAWWVAPLALLGALAAYRIWVIPAGSNYADLFEAAYDAHRFDLYSALRIAPPADASAEFTSGNALTSFVWRGGDPDAATIFVHPVISEDP